MTQYVLYLVGSSTDRLRGDGGHLGRELEDPSQLHDAGQSDVVTSGRLRLIQDRLGSGVKLLESFRRRPDPLDVSGGGRGSHLDRQVNSPIADTAERDTRIVPLRLALWLRIRGLSR
jgi:hypothetical protein